MFNWKKVTCPVFSCSVSPWTIRQLSVFDVVCRSHDAAVDFLLTMLRVQFFEERKALDCGRGALHVPMLAYELLYA